MSDMIYITPGPSQIYPGVDQFLQDAIKEDVCSISHRSAAYKDIHKSVTENLKALAGLPDDFEVYFLGSATEAWERIFTNLVAKSSFHFVNGSFSKKFWKYGVASGKESIKEEVVTGEGFYKAHFDKIPTGTELIAFTHNETSTGVQTLEKDIHSVSDSHKDSLIAVDMVSSFPYPNLDYSKVDTAFFSVQKCMGLPAGLGVWFVNKKCRFKFEQLVDTGFMPGAHHDIAELSKRAVTHQTPSTPNILGIYLLKKVTDAMLAKGLDILRKETNEKYDLLTDYISTSSFLDFGVKDVNHRSRTVVVADTSISAMDVNAKLKSSNLFVGTGYGDKKSSQIRIANFPAISVSTIESLIKEFKKF